MFRRNWMIAFAVPAALFAFVGFTNVTLADEKAPAAGAKEEKKAEKAKDIVDTAVAAGSFKTLAGLLKDAELVEALKGEGPFTVFAPTDEAFAKLPKEALEGLKKDKSKLAAVLKYHVVKGKVMAKDVKAGKVMTLQGTEFTVSMKDKDVMVDAAKVTKTDIECSNGVIHVIDTVIMPTEKKPS